MTTKTEKSEFMLLLRQPHLGPPPSGDEMDKIMARFGTWMNALYAKGLVVATSGLEPTGKVLREPRGTLVTDGPYVEAKEIVGGYVLLKSVSLEEAVEIGRDCPGLDYRMAVEVRPVKYHAK